MHTICPLCKVAVPADGINAATDIAHCPLCNTVHKLSEIVNVDAGRDANILRDEPPSGTDIRENAENTTIEVSMRSVGFGGFMLFFTLFWNLITSIFVVLAVTRLLDLPPGNAVEESGTDEPMSREMAWYLLLFMTPFILIGITTAAIAFIALFGKVRVRLSRYDGVIAVGFGPLCRTKRFDPSAVESIRESQSSLQVNGKHQQKLVLAAGAKQISFGTLLTNARRDWLAAVLRNRLV